MRCPSAVHRACIEPARQSWREVYANNGIRSSVRCATARLPTRFARDSARSFSTTQCCLVKRAAPSISTLDRKTQSGSLSDRKAADSLDRDQTSFPRPLTDPQGPVSKMLHGREDGLLAVWVKKGRFNGPLNAMHDRRGPRDYVANIWLADEGELRHIRRFRDKRVEASDSASSE